MAQNVTAPRRLRREAARTERKAAVATAAPAPRASSPWILDRWRDLLLFVGTPLLLIPIFAAAQVRWSGQDIMLFVGAFGALGHHLPGMIRAYSDRALFNRFKTRFIAAPLLLLIVCMWSSAHKIQALQLVAVTWGIWHGMMQTYGFARIYDCKAVPSTPARARTDLALCFTWFVAAVFLSPMRLRGVLDLYYESGGPLIPVGLVWGLRVALTAAVALVTLAFFWRQWSDWRQGHGFSHVKLTLLATSIGFWWYCNVGVQNLLVGVALFEVFHDVQYLAIVWIYNRTRVERDESIGGFMRFVFRRSGALIGVYVGLVLAYGSIGLASNAVSAELARNLLLGVVTASALLHFYYDGFIWKMREPQTRRNLGLDGEGGGGAKQSRNWPGWTGHTLRWAALAIPVAALVALQVTGRVVPPIEHFGKTAEELPNDALAQLHYGKVLHTAGRVSDAVPYYEKAAQLDSRLAEVRFYLGLAWDDLGDSSRSEKYYAEAVALDPKDYRTETNLAILQAKRGAHAEARRHYEHAISVNPKLVLARKNLADILLNSGEFEAAIAQYVETLNIDPSVPGAQDNLTLARTLARK